MEQKLRKPIAWLLMLAMLFTMLPSFTALATESVYDVVTTSVSPDVGLPDNDELFAMYAEQMLYGYEISTFGIKVGERLSGDERAVYNALVPYVKEIAAGTRASTVIGLGQTLNVNTGNGMSATYTADTALPFSGTDFTQQQLASVMTALLADYPYEMYWYDKVTGTWIEIIGDGTNVVHLRVCMTVAANYRTDTYTTDTAKTGATSTAVANARTVANNATGTDYEKLVAYKNWICSNVSYNTDAANANNFTTNSDPWQLIYVFDGDENTNVVCEGYSKAFQYLCDLGGLDCICAEGQMIGGTGAGPHMWNVVTLEGSNYLVDVTNCDAGTVGAPDKLFMVGGTYNNGYTYTFDENNFVTYTECGDLSLSETKYNADAEPPAFYAITISGSENGTVAADKDSATEGTTVTLTITPETGYGLDVLTVSDGTNTIAVTAGGEDNVYTFIMPAGSVTITATFKMHDHSGGTQTCKGYQCDNCGEWYGEAGEHTPTYTASGNVITESCSVCNEDFGIATITASDATYTGNAQTTATVEYSTGWTGETLTPAYENNTNAGTATAKITVEDVTASITFQINSANIESAIVTVNGNHIYDGTEKTPTDVTVKLGGVSLTPDDFEIKGYSNNINAGTATLTIGGKINYTGIKLVEFIIGKAAAQTISGTMTVINCQEDTYIFDLSAVTSDSSWGGNVSYTLGEINLDESYYTGGAQIKDSKLYLPINWVNNNMPSEIGTVTVTISSKNYEDSILTITVSTKNKTDASESITVSVENITYGADPAPDYSFSGPSNGEPVWTLIYSNDSGASWNTLESLKVDGKLPAGDYKILVRYEDIAQLGERTAEFKVTKADPTFTAPTGLTATYGDTLASVTLNTVASEAGEWTWTETQPDSIYVGNVGLNTHIATFRPHDTNNYNTITVDLTVTVSPKNITDAIVGSFAAMTYTGYAQTPVAAVTIDGLTATGSWSAVTNVGDKTAFTARGNFTGTLEADPGMAKANVPESVKTATGILIKDGTSTVTLPDLLPKMAHLAPVYDSTYITSATVNNGVLTVMGNTAVVENGEYTVTIPVDAGVNYNNYNVTVTLVCKTHEHSWVYTASDDTITATCEGGIGSCPKSVQSIKLAAPSNLVYDGTVKAVTLEGTIDGITIPEVQYISDHKNVGTHWASIKLGEAEAKVSFTITPAKPTFTWTAASQTVTYTGNTAEITAPAVTLVNGEIYTGTISYSYTGTSSGTGLPTDAGTYEITATISAQGNYTAATSINTLTLTINKAAAPTIKWPTARDLVYGQPLSASTLTSTDTNGTFAWQDGTIVPTVNNNGYVVFYTPKDMHNYDYTGVTLTNTIEVTVTAADQVDFSISGKTTATYGDDAITLRAAGGSGTGAITWTITSGNEFAEISGSGSTVILTIKGAGVVVVEAAKAADGNYNANVDTHEITISKATVSVSNFDYESPTDLVYSKTAKIATVTGDSAYGAITIKYYSDSSLTTLVDPINVGTYYVGITTAGGDNYNAVEAPVNVGSFTVTARPVTVTAAAQTMQYGDDVPELTYTHNLIEGDSFTGKLATTATRTSDVGEYAITNGNLANSNYTISYTGAKLTITKANGPAAPTVTGSYTSDGMTYTYTVDAITGAEYSKDGTTWYDSNVFAGLSAGQKYTFYARIRETKNVLAGAIGTSAEVDLNKLPGKGTVEIEGWTYGELPKTPVTNSTTGNPADSYLYESTDGKGYSSANAPAYAGEYKLTVTFKETVTHNGTTASTTFTIAEATPAVTAPTGLTATYGDTLASVQLPEGWAWKDAATTEVGTVSGTNEFTVIYTHPTDAANHNQVEKTVIIAVSPKAVTATVTVVGENFIFNGSEQKPGVTVKDGEIIIPESEYTVSYSENTNAGTAAVTITDKDGGNYTVTGETTFDIEQKASSALSGVEREFLRTIATTGNEIDVETMLPHDHGTVTYTIISSGDTVLENVAVDADGKLVFDTKVSSAAVSDTISVKVKMQNYTDVTLVVSVILNDKAPQKITGVSAVTGLIYNGEAQKGYTGTPTSDYTGSYEITYTGRDNSYNSSTAPTNAGDYTVTLKIPDTNLYFSGNVSVNFTIGKAQATVTAEDKEAFVGSRMPELTYTIIGLIGSDTINIELSCDANMNRAGETPIVVNATDLGGNYEITTVNGTLTVMQYSDVDTIVVQREFTAEHITDDLKEAGLTEVEQIKTYTRTQITQFDSEIPYENTAFFDMILMYRISPNDPWQIADETHFPEEGILVRIDMPEGTSRDTHDFTVAHMFTKNVLGKQAGTFENPPVTEYNGYIEFVVNGLSPIAIGWKNVETEDSLDYDFWYQTVIMLQNQQFNIHASATEGGTITNEGVFRVKYDRSITYTITPDEGYKIVSVLVDGKDVGSVSEYTFKHVTKNHTIKAVFESTKWQNPFTDVSENDWFYEDVQFASENGLMIGTNTAGTQFSPDSTLTRAMLVTVLWRLEGEPIVNYLMPFTDVADGEWYTEAVRWAAAEGIVNGYEDSTFRHGNEITREQVMAILHRYAAYKELESVMIFPMIPQYNYSQWAENDILWANMVGLTSGIGADIFDMTASADRAEIAAYLRRFHEAFMEE